MNDEHEVFEQYLRQFRPRKPGPLPGPRDGSRLRRKLLWSVAALAVGVCAFWIGTRYASRFQNRETQIDPCGIVTAAGPEPNNLTLGRLRTYTRRDPSCLDLVLSKSSREVLPNVEDSRGALRVLADDGNWSD